LNFKSRFGLSVLIFDLLFIPFMALSCAPLFKITLPTQQITSALASTTQSTAVQVTVGEATVVRVIDGDTIDVSIGDKVYRVRYIGMNAPEIGKPYYQEATDKNKELVEGKTVLLVKDISETDKYGRLLRYVYVGDLFVDAELVRLGYAPATPYPPDVKYEAYLKSLEEQAKAANLGMWAK
jgi:endonuclease YncB( thermonuclease family)